MKAIIGSVPMSIYFLLLVLSLGPASAIDFYITSPYSATRWTAGSVAKITWNILEGGSKVDSVNVDLMDGDDSNANVIASLANGVDPGQNHIYWTIPENFAASSSVFIRVSGVGNGTTAYRFSHRFAIESPSAAQKESASVSKANKSQPTIQSTVEKTNESQSESATSSKTRTSITIEPSIDESIPRASVTVLYRQVNGAENIQLGRRVFVKVLLLLLLIAIIH